MRQTRQLMSRFPCATGALAIPFQAADRTYRASRLSYDNRPWVAYDPVTASQKAIASLRLRRGSCGRPRDSALRTQMPTGLCAQLVGQRVAYSHRRISSPCPKWCRMRPPWTIVLQVDISADNRRVISLFDKTTKRELLASEGLGFFTFVRERATPWSMRSARLLQARLGT